MGEHATSAPLTRAALLEYMRRHRLAVQSSVARGSGVQSAAVGIAVGADFEIVFDTLESTRKARNLAADPHTAFVLGGTLDGEEWTVQYEGVAERPSGAELEAARELYFATWPDGRERLGWEGLIHIRVRPTWVRFSDFRVDPPTIVELSREQLQRLQ